MLEKSHGPNGRCFGLAPRYDVARITTPLILISTQIGFSVLASVPGTNQVFPLLGRPHDSLEKDSKE
jgi:hypothetical protein